MKYDCPNLIIPPYLAYKILLEKEFFEYFIRATTILEK